MNVHRYLLLFVGVLLLHGCAVYGVYGLYKTVTDINTTLTQVDNSINRIQRIVHEGRELHRAAEDGKLITTLAERIPTLIQNEVEIATKEKIASLSGDLKMASILFTKSAEEENLPAATKAFDEMNTTSDKFADLMSELSDTVTPPSLR